MSMTMGYRLLGTRVETLTLEDLNEQVVETIRIGERRIIANHNLNSLNLYQRDHEMRAFYDVAAIVHIDGMGVIAVGRALGLPLKREHRVTYVDWVPSLMAMAAAEGWRVYYLGSKPGVAEQGAQRLRESFPGLQIRTHHGFFDASPGSAEDAAVVRDIEAYDPQILMVGMGMPRQERWILQNRHRLRANVILPAGACIDYVAGAIATPPRWMGRFGIEWLYRLMSEPRRLWRRYLIEPWMVLRLLAAEMIRR